MVWNGDGVMKKFKVVCIDSGVTFTQWACTPIEAIRLTVGGRYFSKHSTVWGTHSVLVGLYEVNF